MDGRHLVAAALVGLALLALWELRRKACDWGLHRRGRRYRLRHRGEESWFEACPRCGHHEPVEGPERAS